MDNVYYRNKLYIGCTGTKPFPPSFGDRISDDISIDNWHNYLKTATKTHTWVGQAPVDCTTVTEGVDYKLKPWTLETEEDLNEAIGEEQRGLTQPVLMCAYSMLNAQIKIKMETQYFGRTTETDKHKVERLEMRTSESHTLIRIVANLSTGNVYVRVESMPAADVINPSQPIENFRRITESYFRDTLSFCIQQNNFIRQFQINYNV